MIEVDDIDSLRRQVALWRFHRQRIAFVPTMGNLHDGHLQLVREARQQAERVVVSIFVNPLQFGPHEDFDNYPRTLDQDCALLWDVETDLLFTPSVAVLYPHGQHQHTQVTVPGLSDQLCGAQRPGHFTGVATVVCKLLNLVQPDVALFGEKDFQQLLVIRRMVEDLALPVSIVPVATVREESGLARSSRNRYLTDEQRQQAALLYQTLQWLSEQLQGSGERVALEQQACERLRVGGFLPDYVSVRRAIDLAIPESEDRELVVLAAARLGAARLIDNLRVTL